MSCGLGCGDLLYRNVGESRLHMKNESRSSIDGCATTADDERQTNKQTKQQQQTKKQQATMHVGGVEYASTQEPRRSREKGKSTQAGDWRQAPKSNSKQSEAKRKRAEQFAHTRTCCCFLFSFHSVPFRRRGVRAASFLVSAGVGVGSLALASCGGEGRCHHRPVRGQVIAQPFLGSCFCF